MPFFNEQIIFICTVKQEDPGQLTTKMEVKEEPLSPTKPGTSSTTPSGGKSSKPQQVWPLSFPFPFCIINRVWDTFAMTMCA